MLISITVGVPNMSDQGNPAATEEEGGITISSPSDAVGPKEGQAPPPPAPEEGEHE